MTELIAAAQPDPPAMVAEMQHVEDGIVKRCSAGLTARIRYPLTGVLFMSLEGVARIHIDCRCWLRVARTAVAIERYRVAHGRNPASLADLAPAYLDAVPTDLWDGRPLRYRVEADGGFTIGSIGRDMVDDDGKAKPFGKRQDAGYDIVFRMARPPGTDE